LRCHSHYRLHAHLRGQPASDPVGSSKQKTSQKRLAFNIYLLSL